MLLHSRGLKCDVADNGLNAVEIVEDRGDIIDFVFMDFTMPIMVSLSYHLFILIYVDFYFPYFIEFYTSQLTFNSCNFFQLFFEVSSYHTLVHLFS